MLTTNEEAVVYGMVTMLFFAIIDSSLFLLGEEELNEYLEENMSFLDRYTRPIFISGLASAISILFAKSFTHEVLVNKFGLKIKEHPVIDCIGVLFGMLLVIFIYHLYTNNQFR